ncbi:MAG: hypothetical protein IPK68_22520 [Bdellovibrionales bacterium]|nr:hypothetical protein [Bdellovibrionales bacterium]
MKNEQVFLTSRLSARAIVAGTLSTFALMILLMILAGGFGLWTFNFSELSQASTAFWVWAFVAWTISLYISGYVASISSRSITRRDGALHGFITWASACVLGCLFLAVAAGSMLATMTPTMFWGSFLGDAIALGAAVLGGIQGSRGELQAEDREEKEIVAHDAKLRPAFGK